MADEYWVSGPDGKEYGPASLDNLSQWVRQGRVVPSTRIRKGTGPAVVAANLPEVARLFATQPGAASAASRTSAAPSAAAPGAPSATPGAPSAGAGPGSPLAGGRAPLPSDFHVDAFFGGAWNLVRDNWLVLAAMFFILAAIGAVPHIGCWVSFVISGPLLVGIWRAVLGMIDGRKPTVGMMFEGFDRFLDAFLACLVSSILIGLGFLCVIVPGVILAIMWEFTFPVLGETRLGFWEAMHESAVLTEGYRWSLCLLGLVSVALIVLGCLALGVGVFFALPLVTTATGLAYRFLQQKKGRPARA